MHMYMTENTVNAFDFSPKHNTHIVISKYRQFLPGESTLYQNNARFLCTSSESFVY